MSETISTVISFSYRPTTPPPYTPIDLHDLPPFTIVPNRPSPSQPVYLDCHLAVPSGRKTELGLYLASPRPYPSYPAHSPSLPICTRAVYLCPEGGEGHRTR